VSVTVVEDEVAVVEVAEVEVVVTLVLTNQFGSPPSVPCGVTVCSTVGASILMAIQKWHESRQRAAM